MIALWEQSLRAGRAPDADEQFHYWRRKRFAILQQISRIEDAPTPLSPGRLTERMPL